MRTWAVIVVLVVGLAQAPALWAQAKAAPTEADFYPMTAVPVQDDATLEAGGLEMMPDGRLAIGTRRGEIYMLQNPLGDAAKMKLSLYAQGLHEILGLSYRDGWLYVTQRPEVTKVKDADGDGRADLFLTVSDDWEVSGDYHEYAFGSKFDREGNMWLVLCLTGSFSSNVPYRGWCVRVSADGKFIPTCAGIRSPGGIGFNCEGDVFFCDNQGPWNGTSSLKHLVPGAFEGHPDGLKWYSLPLVQKTLGKAPQAPLDKSRFHIEMQKIPQYRPPAVLIPHGILGNSSSGIACDTSEGKFGPFAKQLFVSDQSFSFVNRVFLEKIDGLYQGVVFPFRSGFHSGNVPSLMVKSGSLFIGGTNRGWGSRGGKQGAVDRLDWSGKVPFEAREMRVKPDGFEVAFTKPIDRASAADPASYEIKTWTYIFQAQYGSPEVDHTTPTIKSVTVADDAMSVRLVIDGLQIGHIHHLAMPGLKSKDEGWPLLHKDAYYTIWHLPKK